MRRTMQRAGLFLFAAAAVAQAGRAVAAGEPVPPHETFTIESAALRETRRVNVYTPPGYDAAGAARYPDDNIYRAASPQVLRELFPPGAPKGARSP